MLVLSDVCFIKHDSIQLERSFKEPLRPKKAIIVIIIVENIVIIVVVCYDSIRRGDYGTSD